MEHSNSDDRLKEKIIEKMREKNCIYCSARIWGGWDIWSEFYFDRYRL